MGAGVNVLISTDELTAGVSSMEGDGEATRGEQAEVKRNKVKRNETKEQGDFFWGIAP
jgi:hypothetical protein